MRVVNSFVLSKIFYRLECVDITKEMKLSIEKRIRDFLWGERRVGRIEYSVLNKSYLKGGLKLLDIESKIKTLRIKWLFSLTKKDPNQIERFLVDKLIGSFRGIDGLIILNHTTELRSFRNIDPFYAKAIKHWRSSGINFEAASLQSIRNYTIFHNKLLLDSNNNPFNFFNANNNQIIIPKLFKDLPVTHNLSRLSSNNRNIIRDMNRAYWHMYNNKLGKYSENSYTIQIGGQREEMDDLCSKQIYWAQISKREGGQIWEGKWNSILRYYTLDMEDKEWESIWQSVHDITIPYEIQSAIWEMIHLNFYCGYKERLLNYGTGHCKLCGELEEGVQHIVIDCSVLEGCINAFIDIIYGMGDNIISKDELAFGLAGSGIQTIDNKDKLRNLITFIIRTVVFKNRNRNYGTVQNAVLVLKAKICYKIREVLKDMHIIYKYKYSVSDFANSFLIDNILGNIQNGSLHINI